MNPDARARRARALAAAAWVLWCGCSRGPAVTPTSPQAGPRPPLAPPPSAEAPGLPPVKPVRGPLQLQVVYPSPDALLQIRDSSFVFGSAGTGEATVTVDGQPAKVWP